MAQGCSHGRLLVVSCLQSAYDSKFSSCPWGLECRDDGIPPAVFPPDWEACSIGLLDDRQEC